MSIKIRQPEEWHNDIVSVSFSVKDTADTGNFEIAKIEAKVGQNGSWTDVTEEKKLRISENCTVYVLVTVCQWIISAMDNAGNMSEVYKTKKTGTK